MEKEHLDKFSRLFLPDMFELQKKEIDEMISAIENALSQNS